MSQQISRTLASAIILRARVYVQELTQGFWLDTEFLTWVNEGTMKIVAQTECLESKQTEQLVANTLSYDLVKTGSHTGTTHATIMTDSTAAYIASGLVGRIITNTTDGSKGTVTANAATTVTVAALAGGTDRQWESGDDYIIEAPYLSVKGVIYNQGSGVQKALLPGKLADIGRHRNAGEPIYWIDYEDTVIAYPKPDASHSGTGHDLDVYTAKRPGDVTAAQNVLVPACYDQALVYFMVAQALIKSKDYEGAAAMLSLHEAEIVRVTTGEMPNRPQKSSKGEE